MAINFGLATAGEGFDYLQSLQALGNQRAQRQQLAVNDYRLQSQQRLDAARPGIAQQVGAGDFLGARSAALAAGDFDYADAIGKMDEQQRKRLDAESQTLGSVSFQLRQIPAQQRQQAFAAVVPDLKRAGFSDAELAQFDLGDQSLDGKIAIASSVKDAIDAQMSAARLGETQRHNLAMESKPRWQFDAESGSWLQEPGTGNGYVGPSTVPEQGYMARGGDPASGGGTFARMIGAESGGRQFGANGQPLTSRAGAIGIAQVMPGTAPEAARLAGLPWDANRYRTDPQYNAALGEAYFQKQLADFGREDHAVAAYNAGPGRVRAAIRRGGENWLAHVPAETQAYVQKVTGGRGAAPQGGQPGVINVRPPKARERAAPSGYQWNGSRLEAIPGGPADQNTATNRNVQSNRKAEADYRKEFEQRQDVKDFRKARTQFNALRDTALNPRATAQDDIAVIFQFMKTLDPTSTVREGEFATAQNAAGVPDTIRNAFNKAVNGERLSPEQRKNMARTAYRSYQAFRDAYNSTAEQYRGYARDYGINPDRVARTYTPDAPPARPQRLAKGQSRKVGNITIKALD